MNLEKFLESFKSFDIRLHLTVPDFTSQLGDCMY